jgi:hypothetical protein
MVKRRHDRRPPPSPFETPASQAPDGEGFPTPVKNDKDLIARPIPLIGIGAAPAADREIAL